MNNEDEPHRSLQRRQFLHLTAGAFGAAAIGRRAAAGTGTVRERLPNDVIRLNPAFRLTQVQPGTVELTTHLPGGAVLSHRFEGIEAEVLVLTQAGRDRGFITLTLADRHGGSMDEVGRAVDRALDEFEAAGLVYAGGPITMKINRSHG